MRKVSQTLNQVGKCLWYGFNLLDYEHYHFSLIIAKLFELKLAKPHSWGQKQVCFIYSGSSQTRAQRTAFLFNNQSDSYRFAFLLISLLIVILAELKKVRTIIYLQIMCANMYETGVQRGIWETNTPNRHCLS